MITKVLIVKIGAIGDVIMALPVLNEIKRKYPDSHVTWVCGNIIGSLLAEISDVDKVIVVNEGNLFNTGKIAAAKEVYAYLKQTFFSKFDIVLNMHHDARYKVFTNFINSPLKLFLTRDGDRPNLIPARSRAFEHVRLFLQNDDNYAGDIFFPKDTIAGDAKTGVGRFVNGIKPLAILAPGGAKNVLSEQTLRRWPVENYVIVATYLLANGYEVILTGAKSDDWVSPYFAHLDIVDSVGALSIVELVLLMRKSAIVLTHDSGPFHLAVFAQRPLVICIFGPTNPREFTYGKLYKNVKTIWGGKNLLCSPCYFGKYFSTQCKNNICMQSVAANDVIALLSEVGVAKI